MHGFVYANLDVRSLIEHRSITHLVVSSIGLAIDISMRQDEAPSYPETGSRNEERKRRQRKLDVVILKVHSDIILILHTSDS